MRQRQHDQSEAMASPSERLIAKIRFAFAGVTCEGGATLADCIIAKGYGSAASITEAEGKFERSDWSRLRDEWIAAYDYLFCYANDAGARFHLPAYMIWVVHFSQLTTRSNTTDFLFSFLCDDARAPAVAAILNNDQKAAVRDFLSFMVNQKPMHCDLESAVGARELWKKL